MAKVSFAPLPQGDHSRAAVDFAEEKKHDEDVEPNPISTGTDDNRPKNWRSRYFRSSSQSKDPESELVAEKKEISPVSSELSFPPKQLQTKNGGKRRFSVRWRSSRNSVSSTDTHKPTSNDDQDTKSSKSSEAGTSITTEASPPPRTTTAVVSQVKRVTSRQQKRNENVESAPPVEADPVVQLFEQRTTQRVRFALEGGSDIIPTRPPPRPCVTKNDDDSKNKGLSTRSSSISRFLKGALSFGGPSDDDNTKASEAQVEAEVQRELASVKHELVWTSTEGDVGGEVVRTAPDLLATFVEDPETRAQAMRLMNKARRAQYFHFRYEYAVKTYMKALDVLQKAGYPNDHPVVVRALESLNHAHHVLNSYENSAKIVKMGIKHEDAGELVRALKMYTIAYRIRAELLGRRHPSLLVLLNMLGLIQIKRGELEEAMQIYALALKDGAATDSEITSVLKPEEEKLLGAGGLAGEPGRFDPDSKLVDAELIRNPPRNLLARSVTYRDMGIIYEKWGETDSALTMYHKSLDLLAEYKQLSTRPPVAVAVEGGDNDQASIGSFGVEGTASDFISSTATAKATGGDDGMEVLMGRRALETKQSTPSKPNDGGGKFIFQASSDYDMFFPPELDELMQKQKKDKNKKNHQRGDFADMDAALTLHQIGQLHRSVGEYNLALSAFSVALRGMKYCVGRNHFNVAAILGNIGNLQKEMGDMDASFSTYQQVLGIESYRLGLTHPDVAVTLHNIATIDAARGNHEHALALYRQVVCLQRKLFGDNHVAVAVTSACMGDVCERVGHITESITCFEEAVRIKAINMGRHSLEVARLLHKLGKLAMSQAEFHVAHGYISRAILIYRLNRLSDDDEWMVDAARDEADVDAALALGLGFDSAPRPVHVDVNVSPTSSFADAREE